MLERKRVFRQMKISREEVLGKRKKKKNEKPFPKSEENIIDGKRETKDRLPAVTAAQRKKKLAPKIRFIIPKSNSIHFHIQSSRLEISQISNKSKPRQVELQ